MELNFLGNKYITSNEPKVKPVVQLKYMGKAYQASMSNASRAVTALTYRGVSYSNQVKWMGRMLPPLMASADRRGTASPTCLLHRL